MKICNKCGASKELHEFNRNNSGSPESDGVVRHPTCQVCHRASATKEWGVKSRAASRLGLPSPQRGSPWMNLPLERRKAELAYQREIDAANGITPVPTPAPKEYDHTKLGVIETTKTTTSIYRNDKGYREEMQRQSMALRYDEPDVPRCIVTGCPHADMNIAAHIVALSVLRKQGRADDYFHPDNGLYLRADVHLAFDKKRVTFTDDGRIIQLVEGEPACSQTMVRIMFTEGQKRYLAEHRAWCGYTP